VIGFCERGDGHAGCVQREEFVEWLNAYDALTGRYLIVQAGMLSHGL
jgi:hypothetical protein